jgi:hypothetical protein
LTTVQAFFGPAAHAGDEAVGTVRIVDLRHDGVEEEVSIFIVRHRSSRVFFIIGIVAIFFLPETKSAPLPE